MSFQATTSLINLIITIFFAVFIYIKNTKSPINKSYAFFTIFLSIWNLGYFLWQISSVKNDAIFWCRILTVGSILIPPTYLCFVTNLVGETQKNKKAILASYFMAAFFLLFAFSPLLIKDALCHLLQGQKIFAGVKCIIDHKISEETSGELLFTKYGLSGTAILDISDEVSIALNRQGKRRVEITVDMAPFITKDALKEELSKRISKLTRFEDMLTGILPNKFSFALKDLLATKDAGLIASSLKERHFTAHRHIRIVTSISHLRGWYEL